MRDSTRFLRATVSDGRHFRRVAIALVPVIAGLLSGGPLPAQEQGSPTNRRGFVGRGGWGFPRGVIAASMTTTSSGSSTGDVGSDGRRSRPCPSDGHASLDRRPDRKAPHGYPAFPPVTDSPGPGCTGNCQRDNYTMYPLQKQFFLNALYGQDQLRQRVAWALHSLIVTSGLDLNRPSWYQPYLDVIDRNVFGNYRQLLYEMTLNPGMGDYLNLNTSTANLPNENYAREIMQLFSPGRICSTSTVRPRRRPMARSSRPTTSSR